MIDVIKKLITNSIPDAKNIIVNDVRGDGQIMHISVASKSFEGKNMLACHRCVNDAIKELLDNGDIHAVSFSTSVE